jgi:O-antigen ligase
MTTVASSNAPGAAGAARGWSETPVWLLVGIGVGILASLAGALPTRWALGFLTAALFGFVVCFVQNLHRFLLAAFALSLQANLSLRFFGQSGGSYVGNSGPTSIELPVCALVALALLATIRIGVRAHPVRLTFPRQFIVPIIALIVAAVTSMLNSPERFFTFCYMVRFTVLAVILAAAANGIRSEDDLRLVVNMFALTLVIQGVVYLIESMLGMTFSLDGSVFEPKDLWDLPRHGGTVAGRPNAFASFIVPLLLIALSRFLAGAEPRAKKALGAVVVIGAATLIGTFTRAAWVGFALGFLYLVFAGSRRGLVGRKSLIMILVSLTIPIVALSGLIAVRLGADPQGAYDERAALMRMGMNVFKHFPIFGCGAGAYGFVFRHFLPPGTEDGWLFIVHNRYVLIAAEMGIIGLAAFVFFLVTAVRQGVATARLQDEKKWMSAIALGCTAGFIGLAWDMFWDVFTGIPVDALLWTLIGLLCAIPRIATRERRAAVVGARC